MTPQKRRHNLSPITPQLLDAPEASPGSRKNHYLPDVGQHPLPPPPPPAACAAPGCRLTDQRVLAKNGIHYFSHMSDTFFFLKKGIIIVR